MLATHLIKVRLIILQVLIVLATHLIKVLLLILQVLIVLATHVIKVHLIILQVLLMLATDWIVVLLRTLQVLSVTGDRWLWLRLTWGSWLNKLCVFVAGLEGQADRQCRGSRVSVSSRRRHKSMRWGRNYWLANFSRIFIPAFGDEIIHTYFLLH